DRWGRTPTHHRRLIDRDSEAAWCRCGDHADIAGPGQIEEVTSWPALPYCNQVAAEARQSPVKDAHQPHAALGIVPDAARAGPFVARIECVSPGFSEQHSDLVDLAAIRIVAAIEPPARHRIHECERWRGEGAPGMLEERPHALLRKPSHLQRAAVPGIHDRDYAECTRRHLAALPSSRSPDIPAKSKACARP